MAEMHKDSLASNQETVRTPEFLDYHGFRSQRFFPFLDAIRAVAVVAVVAWHVGSSDILRWFQGGRGVSWFFALSGFLITTLSLREESRSGSMAIRPFYIRRAFRILPLYMIALLTYFVADVFVFRNAVLTQGWHDYWPYYLTFLQDIPILLKQDAPFQVAWSLAVEERFYLLWPALGFVLFTRRNRLVVTSFLACSVAFVVAVPTSRTVSALIDPLLPISLGCLAAVLLHDPSRYRRFREVLTTPILIFAVLLVLVPWPGALTSNALFPIGYSVVLAATVSGAAMLATDRVTVPAWVLWLGVRSYGIYLFHTQAIRVADKVILRSPIGGEPSRAVTFVLALALSCLVADLLHRSIERPLAMRGRRIAAA